MTAARGDERSSDKARFSDDPMAVGMGLIEYDRSGAA